MITIDLFETLQTAWDAICADYDVSAALPDIDKLFDGVDPSVPGEAAQAVVVNLLSDVMETVSRFSPWYRKPASAFGIALHPDPCQWALTDDKRRSCRALLAALEAAIAHNQSVILAAHYFQHLDRADPCRAITCQCIPPRTIIVHQSVILPTPIICDTCRQPFL